MNLIEKEELKEKIDQGDDFKLVMTLNEWAFKSQHIPGSINIYNPEGIEKLLSKDDEIIVYCTAPTCIASIAVYAVLNSAGFSNIRRYAGGLEDWEAAGYPLERDVVA